MTRRLQSGIAALAAVSVLVLLPAASLGFDPACGGVETAKARKNVNPGGHAPLAIGDSTMLLALPPLSREGYQVNAHGCRQIEEGLDVMREAKRANRLPHLVVIALGADASISPDQLAKAFHIAGPKRVIGLVTPIELGGGTSSDADVVRAAAKRHPKRSVLLDWVAYSSGHSDWFQPDGLHLTFDGADGFARLLKQALPYARAGVLPGRPPKGKSGLDDTPIPVSDQSGT
jgi:hypothetical protein